MRNYIILASATALAACGGAGPQSAGSVGAPSSGGSGSTGTFVNPTETKTYDAIGGAQHFAYKTRDDGQTQYGELYAGDANTPRDGGITVAYNPRDAIFEVTVNRPLASVSTGTNRFQDPAHRVDFGGLSQPQADVPQLPAAANIQYLQAGSSSGPVISGGDPNHYVVGNDTFTSQVQTFFYQKPGTTTQYVTYAGYVRNTLGVVKQTDPVTKGTYLENSYSLDRAVFAYGERSDNSVVPKTGSASFTGDMLATMVFNPLIDTDPLASTYFQWITGSQTTTVDFAKLSVSSAFNGTVSAAALDAYTNGNYVLPGGTTFTAHGSATIDLVGKGGFTGTIGDAKFTTPGGKDYVVSIAGSSLDGAFFGPAAQEIGGGFRIVGGTPDQRIDILGAYTGKK
ncbi:transferrin-binding protein-like solute binding protein [Sphingomonas sp. CL5.1]|uniref:transferrin-binding protein-like solute binding protein n=1 Tax=Sphingomonas sp. CL5.1 TaxID=2653203 RepID=UPI001582C147|nr:transferrin-binding protein-like solute binding protein [Sphingomonas sp. CL5.1]QKS01661.1 transferrin-binding protein-like solute binding protein [Sphingomonas sp. CL5.1]